MDGKDAQESTHPIRLQVLMTPLEILESREIQGTTENLKISVLLVWGLAIIQDVKQLNWKVDSKKY